MRTRNMRLVVNVSTDKGSVQGVVVYKPNFFKLNMEDLYPPVSKKLGTKDFKIEGWHNITFSEPSEERIKRQLAFYREHVINKGLKELSPESIEIARTEFNYSDKSPDKHLQLSLSSIYSTYKEKI